MIGFGPFIFLFCSFSINIFAGLAADAGNSIVNKKCAWIKNATKHQDDFTIDRRQGAVEECLWYTLSENAIKDTGIPRALSRIPPANYPSGNDKVTIFMHRFKLENFKNVGDHRKNVEVTGRIFISWHDNRFRWDANEWKVNVINIKSSQDIWLPEPSEVYYVESFFDYQNEIRFVDIKATRTGNVSAQLEFTALAECQSDEINYPMENSHCDIKLGSETQNQIREYQIENYRSQMDGSLDLSAQRSVWTVKNLLLTVPASDSTQQIKICVDATRSSALLKMELLLPMFASAIFLLASPFFGSMKAQAYVKMFALLVQILCFQFLLQRHATASFAQVPKIFRFYEITLGTTLASLILTLIINSLNRFKKTLPPPHRLQLAAKFVNQYLCCAGSGGDIVVADNYSATTKTATIETGSAATTSVDLENGNKIKIGSANLEAPGNVKMTETRKHFLREWREVFLSFNYLVSAVLLMFYLVLILFTCV